MGISAFKTNAVFDLVELHEGCESALPSRAAVAAEGIHDAACYLT